MFDLCGKVLILVHIQAFMILDDAPLPSPVFKCMEVMANHWDMQ